MYRFPGTQEAIDPQGTFWTKWFWSFPSRAEEGLPAKSLFRFRWCSRSIFRLLCRWNRTQGFTKATCSPCHNICSWFFSLEIQPRYSPFPFPAHFQAILWSSTSFVDVALRASQLWLSLDADQRNGFRERQRVAFAHRKSEKPKAWPVGFPENHG